MDISWKPIKKGFRKMLRPRGSQGEGASPRSSSPPASTSPNLHCIPGTSSSETGQPLSVMPTSAPIPTQATVSAPPLTTSNTTVLPVSSETDLWALAYDEAQKREGELMADYMKYLVSQLDGTATGGDFSNVQSVQRIVHALLQLREKKKLQLSILGHNVKIRTEVEKLAKLLVWSDPIVQSTVSTQPCTALAWCGFSLLLPLITSGSTQNEDMLTGFNEMSNLQLYWRSCEVTYLKASSTSQHYQHSIEPLVTLYSFIVEYQARVVCHLSKPQLWRAWEDVTESDNWIKMTHSMKKLDEGCLRFINHGNNEEVRQHRETLLETTLQSQNIQQEILQNIKKDKQDQAERRLFGDLAEAAGDYERNKNINPKRVAGTCEWFLMNEQFCQWRDANSSSLLWVSAGPGRGKSVLARSLIDEGHLQRATTITVESSTISATSSTICYFFFKDGGEGPMNGAQALCAILHQLFRASPTSELIQHALPSHKQNGSTVTQKFRELWTILVESTRSTSNEIICILDALDECSEVSRQEIIGALKEFYTLHNEKDDPSRLKFLITSRPYEDLGTSFQRIPATAAYLHFDGDEKSDQINREIDLVIDDGVNRFMGDFTVHDRLRISKRLKEMENRTYLWLHLTFNIINRKRSKYARPMDIETLLSELPSEVSDAYEKILARSQDDHRTAILLQIMLAAARPLTLDEANNALALGLEKHQLSSYGDLQGLLWPSSTFKTMLENLCGLYVSVYDSKLSFIHQTAREFLVHPEKGVNWKGRFRDRGKSHGTISKICIRYLLIPDLTPIKDGFEPSFLSYAASSWPLHFRSQDADLAAQHQEQARELCRVSKPSSRYCRAYLAEEDWRLTEDDWNSWSDLGFASYLGLADIANYIIINEQADVNDPAGAGLYKTAMYAALHQGHLGVIRVLLSHRVDITEDMVVIAATNPTNSKEMVTLLLDERGEQIVVTEDIAKGAANNLWNGKEIMALLLDRRGDQITITEEVIKAAADNYRSGKEVMALLLGHQRDQITITEDVLKTVARNPGNGKEIMALFLDQRRDQITITDEVIKTSMDNYWNGKGIIALILEKGGDHIAITEALLKAVIRYDDLHILDRFLERLGKESELTQLKLRSTALHIVIATNKPNNFQKFLGHDVDINYQDRNGWTPLALAIGYEREDMIELLRDRDAVMGLESQLPPTEWEKSDKKHVVLSVDKLEVAIAMTTNLIERVWPYKVKVFAAVKANQCMPLHRESFYFEVTISMTVDHETIAVGFCYEDALLRRILGWDSFSWGYHGNDGRVFHDSASGKSYGPTYISGDTIGCGVNFKTKTAFFTKNGSVLGCAFGGTDIKGQLYPAVSLRSSEIECKFRVNFGPEGFLYTGSGTGDEACMVPPDRT